MRNLLIASEGIPYIIVTAIILVFLVMLSLWSLVVTLPFLLFFIYFFRNPKRNTKESPDVFFSPADGRVLSISKTGYNDRIGEQAVKISIFLSIFNVHINRAPMSGHVVSQTYRPGKFLPAFKSHASEINERNEICFGNDKCKFIVNQITGFVARRIVSDLSDQSHVTQHQRIGMIKFGSCTELIIPEYCIMHVNEGQKVKGAETVLASLDQSFNI